MLLCSAPGVKTREEVILRLELVSLSAHVPRNSFCEAWRGSLFSAVINTSEGFQRRKKLFWLLSLGVSAHGQLPPLPSYHDGESTTSRNSHFRAGEKQQKIEEGV